MNHEQLQHLKLHGPSNFDEAEIVRHMFAQYAQAALAEGNAHEILRHLGELYEWGRQLVLAQLYLREEARRRESLPLSPLSTIIDVMMEPKCPKS